MLSTHVLDIARGVPAAGVAVELARIGADRAVIAREVTDADGRIRAPFGGALVPGVYELVFHAGAYFSRWATASIYDEIAVRFTISADAQSLHVPLLLAPHGYSTYRGS